MKLVADPLYTSTPERRSSTSVVSGEAIQLSWTVPFPAFARSWVSDGAVESYLSANGTDAAVASGPE